MRRRFGFSTAKSRRPRCPSKPGGEIGFLLRQLQEGIALSLPASRPMPEIEHGCHELRVKDGSHDWRVAYAVERDAILILGVFEKDSKKAPKQVKEVCRKRVREYRRLVREEK